MTVITIPKILRDKLTEEGADAFVQILDKVEERSQKATLEISEERFEKRIAQLEAELGAKIEGVRSDLGVKIAQSEARMIRWVFIFWVGQVGTITAILFAFFRK